MLPSERSQRKDQISRVKYCADNIQNHRSEVPATLERDLNHEQNLNNELLQAANTAPLSEPATTTSKQIALPVSQESLDTFSKPTPLPTKHSNGPAVSPDITGSQFRPARQLHHDTRERVHVHGKRASNQTREEQSCITDLRTSRPTSPH